MDWLAEQCRRIQEQKLKQERSIRYLKQLFKAWPVKAELEEEKSERQTASNRVKKNDELENSDDRLTAEEKEGLLMMDQLLSKAQKARDLQKKLEEPKKPKTIQSVKQKTKIDHDLNQNDKTGMETGDKKELQKRLQEVEIVGNVQTSKVPQEITHHANAPAKNKPVSCGKPQGKGQNKANLVEKIERPKISQRPQSSSGTRKVVPVHVNAPFQTNPNLRSSKLQTTYKAATAKTLSKSRGAGSAGSRAREAKGSERKETVASRFKSIKTEDENVKRKNLPEVDQQIDYSVKMDADVCKETENSLNMNCNNDVEFLKLDAISIEDSQDTSAGNKCHGSEDKDSDELFFLKKDGAHLSVPARLKKLVYQNRKFRQKLYAQTVTQKVRTPHASADFPQCLQCAFGDEADQQIQLQAKQAQHITSTYTSLLHMMDNLHLDHISVDSDPADIYYCKKMVEHILLTFQELEQNLHTSDFRMLSSVVTPSTRSIKLPQARPSGMSVWYEKNILTGNHCSSKVFQYGSYKLLERYMDIVYQVQLLQLQIDVMDTVSRLLLPLLHTLDPSTSEFARVLRAGYSLMSINRNNQPVIVKDTIQDESTLQHED